MPIIQPEFDLMIIEPHVRQKLIDRVLSQTGNQSDIDDESIKKLILLAVAEELSGSRLTFQERQSAALSLFHALRGLDLLQPLLDDPTITEIMVNGPAQIFFEKSGKICASPLHFNDAGHLAGVITNFFGRANRQIHEKSPLADIRLPDGSRAHAVLPPVAPDGPVLTIRKFSGLRPDMTALLECGFISERAAEYLIQSVCGKESIFICGGTGTGKTTFLNILSKYIPEQERVITIEDSAELALQNMPNLVRLEARLPGPDGEGEISLGALIRAALRMRPDRIIVGEVRGVEAFDMLQAMNTGHPGSLSTGHGNSCQDMLDRLALMVLMAINLPWDAIRRLITSALGIIVHLRRTPDGRREIHEISRIKGFESDQICLQPVFFRTEGGHLDYVES
jgi:pilus assembly protein CpaF